MSGTFRPVPCGPPFRNDPADAHFFFRPPFFAFAWNSHAAWTLPWSVIAGAGCSNSWARRIRSSIRLAPSRSEYSEWQWRWTKDMDREG